MKSLLLCLCLWASALPLSAASQPAPLELSGQWRFALDPADVGVNEQWSAKSLTDHIVLPGILQAQGFGNDISTNTPWVLSLYDRLWYLREDYAAYTAPGRVKVPFLCQPPKHYLGAAWYQRDIDIPADWQHRRVVLFLERPHWESTVWLDQKKIGGCSSLVAPHTFELGQLAPGHHILSIRVDNRMLMPYRPDGHSVSDSLGSSWNGIAGKIEFRATSLVWLDDVHVFPNVEKKSAMFKVRLGNLTGTVGNGTLSANKTSLPVSWNTNGGSVSFEVSLGPDAQLWDEFNPALQHIVLRLTGTDADDSYPVTFGLRDFHAQGQEFTINGRKVNLRGTHNGGDFPLTGYPPTDDDYWRKLFATCRQWGLNHMRFHSWCPPEAAFIAADELGFYLQPECGMWNEISPGTKMEQMLYKETERMLRAYGNHPSFTLLSPSNEPKGRWKESLPRWVEHFHNEDPRHLYTTGTGWSLVDKPGPVQGADYLAVGRIGMARVRGESAWFGRDYAQSLRGVDVPVLAHELGQWCAYPDYDIVKKFTGYLHPGNYEIFRDSLEAHGLLAKNKDFALASGKFQLSCYKEEIEANLRTPGLAGFQLLDLHDYIGQGTALVGLLDTFWESKGYVTPEEFRAFCNVTVPLARLTRRVFTTTEKMTVPVEVAHYGNLPLTNAQSRWQVVSRNGQIVREGQWPSQTIPIGKAIRLGTIDVELSALPVPEQYRLVVSILPYESRGEGFTNSWNFWVYPAQLGSPPSKETVVTRSWDEAETNLASGRKVLFLPRPADLDWSCPPLERTPIFWNRLMNPGWGRMLGTWCDTNHPALAEFPTDYYCDWQWTELLHQARAMNLDRLPRELQPFVQAIDDWNRNYKLGLLFECKVGPGRLLACSLDIDSTLDSRPVARQLRRSLLDYMADPRFQPRVEVAAADFRGFLFDTHVMHQLGANARADGADASAILDGDPNTSWPSGSPGRRADTRKYPHELDVSFPAPVSMKGLVLMNRQNDRDHLGDIRTYTLEASDDEQSWREVHHGELLSTWRPQTITFASPITTSHLRLTALSGFGPDTTAALAELAVIYAGEKLPEDTAAAPEYQRARSTSTDVDEPSTPSVKK
jgi:hypothetical protein